MMNTRIFRGWAVLSLAIGLIMAATPLAAQNSRYQEGLHYFRIDQVAAPSTDGMIEVVEAFSYLCPHCNTFEPFINKWLEDKPENVKFTRIPVIFGRRTWELYARAYVTADMMGIAEEAHGALMDALYKEKRILRDIEELGEFYADYGVSADEFVATSQSFAVDARLRKDQRLTQTYGISGTPTMVVNGKYLIKGSQAVPNYDTMLDVVNTLIAREQAELAAASEETGAEVDPATEAAEG